MSFAESYRRRVWDRAWEDTKAVTHAKNRGELAVSAAVFVAVSVLLYVVAGTGPTVDLFRLTLAGIGGFVIVFVAVLALHLVWAPGRLAREDATHLAVVQQERDAVRSELEKRHDQGEVIRHLTTLWADGSRRVAPAFPVAIPYDRERMKGAIVIYDAWVEQCADFVNLHRPAYLLKLRDAARLKAERPNSARLAGVEDDDGKTHWYDYERSGDYAAAIERVRAILREIIEA